MSPLPRIFISAATKELAEVRKHVTNIVLQQQCYPVVEEGFEGQPDDVSLTRFLKLRLQLCDAVIHFAGRYFGGESPRCSSRSPRCSWTHMEYHLARRLRKKILVGLAGPKFGGGARHSKKPAAVVDQKQKTKLQQQHYAALEKGRGLYYPFNTAHRRSHRVPRTTRKPQTARKVKVLFVAAEFGAGLDLRGQLRIIKQAVRGSDITINPFLQCPRRRHRRRHQSPQVRHHSSLRQAGLRLHPVPQLSVQVRAL